LSQQKAQLDNKGGDHCIFVLLRWCFCRRGWRESVTWQ